MIVPFCLAIAALTAPAAGSSGPFVHPGLLNTRAELDFVRAKVADSQDLWKTGFNTLKRNALAKYLTRQPAPHAVYTDPPHWHSPGPSQDLKNDAEAIYGDALMWEMTRDSAYARKATEILDAWSTTLKTLQGDVNNEPVLSTSYHWPCVAWAAELLRDSYPPFRAGPDARFRALARDLLFPVGSTYVIGNNWWSWSICFRITFGVYLDDRAIFDSAAADLPRQIKNYIIYDNPRYEDQEICRDLTHAQMGIAPLVAACEIAWKQGLDLYGYDDNRLWKGLEHLAPILMGDYSQSPCGGTAIIAGDGEVWYFWEMAYNHYHNRAGLPCPNMEKILGGKLSRMMGGGAIRPELFNRMGYGTLTHYGLGAGTSRLGPGRGRQDRRPAATWPFPWPGPDGARDAAGRAAPPNARRLP